MDNIIFYPGPPPPKCRRPRPASALDAGSRVTGSELTAAQGASKAATCGGVQRAEHDESLTSAAPTPTDIDCVGGLHSHDGAPSANLKTPLPKFTPADTSASIAALHSAGIMDALSTFIAAFGDETHDTQEFVDVWRTAASESDGAFWHEIQPPDDFAAPHGAVSDATSAHHGDAQDERTMEPRIAGALDCRTPRPAGEDTVDRIGICPEPRQTLDVEGVGGLLVAGSGIRAESAQPISHSDETLSPAPSRPQSIAAAAANGSVTEEPFGGLNYQSNAPVMQWSDSMGLADDAGRSDLEHRGLAEFNKDSSGIAGPLSQASGAASDGSDEEGAPYVPRRWRGRHRHPSPSISDGCASDAACATNQNASSPSHWPPSGQAYGPSPRLQRCRAPQRRSPARPRKRRPAREASSLSATPQPVEPLWAVDRIVSSVRRKGKLFYRVRWEDTWEPAESLDGCADIAIADFLALTRGRTKMPGRAVSGII